MIFTFYTPYCRIVHAVSMKKQTTKIHGGMLIVIRLSSDNNNHPTIHFLSPLILHTGSQASQSLSHLITIYEILSFCIYEIQSHTSVFCTINCFFLTAHPFFSQVDTSLAHFVCSVVARILAFTNSCVNPIALCLLSKTFQKQFNQQLCCCCRTIPKLSLRSPTQCNTRGTSVRSTHQSVASLNINGRWLYQEDGV